jgi:hypothetical protein
MNTWRPARSVAGPLIAALAVGCLLVAGGLAWLAWDRFATGFDFGVFLYALLAGLCAAGAAWAGYQLLSVARLRYTLDRNALIIHWGGLRQVVPLARVREAVAVADLPAPQRPRRPRGPRWPGLWVGAARGGADQPVLAYATAPPGGQVLVITPTVAYAVSPAPPADLLAELARRQALGPTQDPPQGTEAAAWATHPLLHDRLAVGLLLLGLVLNLALWGYLAVMVARLPDLFPLHWNTQGEADLIGHAEEVLRLPIIALGLWLADAGLAALLHRRERLAALFLYSGGVGGQIVFWAAALTIVLRAVAGE